jgi:large subunit ribosomal protein L10e
MAGLRKACCYRRIKRAYTRKSKYKYANFVKAVPFSKIVRYEMGDLKKQFSYRVDLVSRDNVQVRHNALESCRQIVNRNLIAGCGNNYKLQVRAYPHHVLRENKMLTGAGADRVQTGMQLAFGRAVGIAAQVRMGKVLMSASVDEGSIEAAKKSLQKAKPRLPGRYAITWTKVA